jgi:hypothetical protein
MLVLSHVSSCRMGPWGVSQAVQGISAILMMIWLAAAVF